MDWKTQQNNMTFPYNDIQINTIPNQISARLFRYR